MRTALKAAVVLLPIVAVFLGLKLLRGNEPERWLERVRPFDPDLEVVVSRDRLLVLAPNPYFGVAASATVERFRDGLVREYGDLLGRPRSERLVVVLFSSLDRLQAYYGDATLDLGGGFRPHGFTVPRQGAIFLPPASTIPTLHHETVHWIMAMGHGGTVRHSPWLSEGLAQLFESWAPEAGPPRLDGHGRALLRATAPPDVDRLLALEEYKDFLRRDVQRNYMDSLALTAFLFETRREGLQRYVDLERRASTGRAGAFADIFRHQEPAFREAFADYLGR